MEEIAKKPSQSPKSVMDLRLRRRSGGGRQMMMGSVVMHCSHSHTNERGSSHLDSHLTIPLIKIIPEIVNRD